MAGDCSATLPGRRTNPSFVLRLSLIARHFIDRLLLRLPHVGLSIVPGLVPCAGELAPDAEMEVGYPAARHHSRALELDGLRAQVVEQPDARDEQDRYEVEVE